jgi:hypothetical protein
LVTSNKIGWLMVDEPNGISIFFALSGLVVKCYLTNGSAEKTEYDSDFQDLAYANNVIPQVTTQYEVNNKTLTMAKGKIVMDGVNHSIEGYIPVPGTFGVANSGRYVSGGWGTISDFDPDDYIKVFIKDKDRLISTYVYSGATDAWMQANTEYTEYPIIGSYTDDYQTLEANKGWYFWPSPSGYGEIEIEPIGGYAFIPAGMYLEIVLVRPNKVTGWFTFNVYWGKYDA